MSGKGRQPAAKVLLLSPAIRMLQLLLLISGKPGVGQLRHTHKLRHQVEKGVFITFLCSKALTTLVQWVLWWRDDVAMNNAC